MIRMNPNGPSAYLRSLALGVVLGIVTSAGSVLAQPAKLSGGPRPEISHEIPPVASLTVAAVAQLHGIGFDQAAVAAGGGAARAKLVTGGSDYVLLGSPAADVPRRMVGPGGSGAAFLLKISMPTVDAASAHVYYALVTATNTRLAIWAYYEDMPGDEELLKRMTATLAHLEQPKLVFDPQFKAPTGSDPDRYVLK